MEHPWLGRYLAGECSEAEAAEVREWIAASPEHHRAFVQFESVWRASPTEAAWDADAAWATFDQARHEPPRLTLQAAAPERARTRARGWAVGGRVAAALALVVGGAFAGRAVFSGGTGGGMVAEGAMRTAVTPRGQRAVLRLPDGTNVMLAAASTLRYPETFNGDSRDVTLEGEAYFEVRHDEQRPFRVRAGNLLAEDLGTEFVVRAYPEQAQADVVVREGLVAIQSRQAADTDAAVATGAVSAVLEPGQLGRISVMGKPVVERADTAARFAWTRGQLILAGTPLRDAAVQLGRWYDVDVRLAAPELGDRRLEASFEDEPVADVFRLIAASLNLRVAHEGRVYTLRAK